MTHAAAQAACSFRRFVETHGGRLGDIAIYDRPALNKVMLGELIDLVSGIATNPPSLRLQMPRHQSPLSTTSASEQCGRARAYPPDRRCTSGHRVAGGG
jgi:hypothetical protein